MILRSGGEGQQLGAAMILLSGWGGGGATTLGGGMSMVRDLTSRVTLGRAMGTAAQFRMGIRCSEVTAHNTPLQATRMAAH